jgi:hypothetical protein
MIRVAATALGNQDAAFCISKNSCGDIKMNLLA